MSNITPQGWGPYSIGNATQGTIQLGASNSPNYLVVNNPGSFWIFFPQVKQWVPPQILSYSVEWDTTLSPIVQYNTTVSPNGTLQTDTTQQQASINGSIEPAPNVNQNAVTIGSITGNVNVIQNQSQLMPSIPVNPTAPGQNFSQSYTLPQGTQSLILLCTGNWAPNTGTGGLINVIGNTTGIGYSFLYPPKFTITPPPGPGFNQVGIGTNWVNLGSGADSSVTIEGIGPTVGTGLGIIVIASPLSQLSEVDLRYLNSTEIAPGQDLGGGGTSSLPVVPAEFYRPTPWQAPQSLLSTFASYSAVRTTLLTPAAGMFFHLFNWALALVSQPSATEIWLEWFDGTNHVQLVPTFSTTTGILQGNLSGQATPPNAVINMVNNTGSAVAATAIVGYTQSNY